jgi:anthranilate/para-aminobenzoate synthase component II
MGWNWLCWVMGSYVPICHTRFLYQNQVLIICMTHDQLFHTYGSKVFSDNHMSRIKYNYYISNVSKDYDGSQQNGTTENSVTPQERQPGQHVT